MSIVHVDVKQQLAPAPRDPALWRVPTWAWFGTGTASIVTWVRMASANGWRW